MDISVYTKRLERVKQLRGFALKDKNHLKVLQANHIIHNLAKTLTNATKP